MDSIGALSAAALKPCCGQEHPQVSQMRGKDAEVRAMVQQAMAQAGADGVVNTDITYAIGPDGQVYAVGGTVTTSERSHRDGSSPYEGPLHSQSFSDIQGPKVDMSPLELADLQAEQEPQSNEAQVLAKLQAADAGVRSHEAQHFRAGGGLVNGVPEYDYAVGPDGQLYAVGGHVNVSTTPTADPDKAARDSMTFANAATAPGDASAQDMSVARSAYGKAASHFAAAQQPEPQVNLAV